MGYLDDIIIFSRSEEEHLDHIEQVFQRLEEAGLKLSLEKCSFFKKHCYIRIPESIQNILIVKYRNKSVEIKAIVLILL